MWVVKLEPDIMSYSTWQPAPSLLSEMSVAKLALSILSHRTPTSVCEKRWQWQPARSLLIEMWMVNMEPAIESFRIPIRACDQGGQWQLTLSLLRVRSVVKLEPDILNYITWQPAFLLLSEMMTRGIGGSATRSLLKEASKLPGPPWLPHMRPSASI
ncbi:unnamed protein product [Prorocentrum cordatum]|uniref:Autophagy protein 5 n=1 Tax=Prorocentrum cordatum TaxID=2364126 RepID=A0ABN9V9N3_9DINO|nr:unnamed protein product [Polarella glacialis]